MKVGLILPGNIWFSPYVKIYTKMLDEMKVSYDLISWNRDGKDQKIGYQYESKAKLKGRLSKILPYLGYAKYIKKIVKTNQYDRLIVFGPQIAIFLSRFLSKRYKGKFLFDYRDLSIEQKSFLKRPFKNVLVNSYANVISSPGFKRCLPEDVHYLLSHNFDIDLVKRALAGEIESKDAAANISVLTIGGIRDYSSNIDVVKALANKEGFQLHFVGKGGAAQRIQEYVEENKIQNVDFEGFYPKEKEAQYIQDATFLNIFYPKIISHETALSNRFYNSLIYKKPMIVTSNSIQGDYVEKYQLGLSLDDCTDLDVKIKSFLNSFDKVSFEARCDELLSMFLKDYDEVYDTVKTFLGK